MMSYEEHPATFNRESRMSFTTYFVAGSGILVALMFLSAALYLATMT